jgi:Uma2 family endonuclease
MSLRKHDVLAEIEYPESDGAPMAETEIHAELMINLRFALKRRFRDDPNVYVGVNMLMYWIKGDSSKSKAPDVFVVFGVPKEPARRTWKIWEEGKAPDMVIEISSRKTWQEDMYEKWQLYSRLGVREYFLFDPLYEYLPEPLMAWRLVDGQYIPAKVENRRVMSEVLGLELFATDTTLRLIDPKTGEILPTEAEEIAAREAAEAFALKETKARRQAEERAATVEAELEKLRAELARLKRKPAKKRSK